MAFQYELRENGIAVTGYEGEISHLLVPENRDGRPVRTIARSAFSRRAQLHYVRLPATLERLEKFAFFGCGALSRVALCDSITDYCDGVFRQCGALREFELTVSAGRYSVLRELLADCEGEVHVLLRLPGGEARLTFPDYLFEYQEDTHARAFHSSFVGAGYTYRECVSRTGVDFPAYDRCFSRVCRGDVSLAARIALDRLAAPRDLRDAARAQYERFLREQAEAAVTLTVKERREDWLQLLLAGSLLTPEAAGLGARLASERGLTALVSALMSALPRSSTRGRLTL